MARPLRISERLWRSAALGLVSDRIGLRLHSRGELVSDEGTRSGCQERGRTAHLRIFGRLDPVAFEANPTRLKTPRSKGRTRDEPQRGVNAR